MDFSNIQQEAGVFTLEMDTVFTKDGVPVIWHDASIFILQLREILTPSSTIFLRPNETNYMLDNTLQTCSGQDSGLCKSYSQHTLKQNVRICSQGKLPFTGLHNSTSPTRIATLEELLDLVTCCGDKGVTINLETKLDLRTLIRLSGLRNT